MSADRTGGMDRKLPVASHAFQEAMKGISVPPGLRADLQARIELGGKRPQNVAIFGRYLIEPPIEGRTGLLSGANMPM